MIPEKPVRDCQQERKGEGDGPNGFPERQIGKNHGVLRVLVQ